MKNIIFPLLFLVMLLAFPGAVIKAQNYDNSLDIAYSYLNSGKTNDAIKIFENHLISHPDDMKIYLQLGYAYKQIGNNEKATKYFNIVSSGSNDIKEITAANSELSYLKAKNTELIALNNLSEEMKKDQTAIKEEEELNKGYEFMRQGSYYNAAGIFEKYKLNHPENTKINLQLGYLYSELKDYEKALDNFEYVENNSKDPAELDDAAVPKYYVRQMMVANAVKSLSVYFYSVFDTYYDNFISNLLVHLNYKAAKNLHTGFYIDSYLDSRSKSGSIFNDRYFEGGGFLKFKLTESVGMELRAGYVREIDFNKNSFNFKPIIYGGTRIGYPLFYYSHKNTKTNYLYFDIFSTGLYDHKFRNFFGQFMTKEVLRSMAGGFSYFEFYLSQTIFADSKQFDYNNYAEFGFGINFKPNSSNFPVIFIEASNKTFLLGPEGKYFQGSLKNNFQFKGGFLMNFNTIL